MINALLVIFLIGVLLSFLAIAVCIISFIIVIAYYGVIMIFDLIKGES